jgi:hypothetical protein
MEMLPEQEQVTDAGDGHAGDGHAGDGHAGSAGGNTPSEAGGGGGQEVTAGGAAGHDSASAGAPENGGTGGANSEQETNREWAIWTMPNPASAGLPHAADYEVAPNNLVVQDRITGLMWQRGYEHVAYALADARANCRALTFGGYDDWRLPTMIEMFSILDWTHTNPAINQTGFYFGSVSSPLFWTTTSNPEYPDNGAWVMDFGSLFSFAEHHFNDTFPSLCVRGGNAPPTTAHYTIDSDVVLDTNTGLTWERHPALTEYTQVDAAAHCDALELKGMNDWRLPSVGEIASLYDFKTTNALRVDLVAFPADGASVGEIDYWGAGGWRFDFWGVALRHSNGAPAARVRCVR